MVSNKSYEAKNFYERIDGIPLIISLANSLKISETINRYLPKHGNMPGIGYGELLTGWLAFNLTEGNHRKSHAEKWAQEHHSILHKLISHKIREKDFSDDRLSRLLNLLSCDLTWHSIETELWHSKVDIFDLSVNRIRLDSTSSYGYHLHNNGIMQFGFSKDDKHDLPQLKIMAAIEAETGSMIAADTVAGNINDDLLYLPLIERLKQILKKSGFLFCGDSKMSSISIRSYLSKTNDYYLTPLQNHKGWKDEFSKWIENAVNESSDFKNEQKISLAWKEKKLLGGGYEHFRTQIDEDRGNKWKERVIVFRSLNLAQTQIAGLEKRLMTAETKIKDLASPEKINKKKDLDDLKAKTAEILKAQDVERLLEITWKEVKTTKEYQRTEKRKGKAREGSYCITSSSYEIQDITKNQKSIKDKCDRCGWRMYVTNAAVEKLSFQDAVCFYREGWKIECLFHFLKTHPICIRPLFVRDESQLKGLSRFLTIALRLLTHMELKIHTSLDKRGAYVKEIYKGQPQKKTRTPSGILVLEAFEGISFFNNGDDKCFITNLSKSAEIFLDLLDMKSLYQDILKV